MLGNRYQLEDREAWDDPLAHRVSGDAGGCAPWR